MESHTISALSSNSRHWSRSTARPSIRIADYFMSFASTSCGASAVAPLCKLLRAKVASVQRSVTWDIILSPTDYRPRPPNVATQLATSFTKSTCLVAPVFWKIRSR